MKFTMPFTILKDGLKNRSQEKVSCFIDDKEVPIQACDIELEENLGETNYRLWDSAL